MNILFLDDNPTRIARFRQAIPYATIVETAKECIEQIDKEQWDWIFLDHDLGGEEFVDSDRSDTGMEVIRHLIEHKQKHQTSRVVVHSLNSLAREQMCLDLLMAGYDALPMPFPLVFRFVDEQLVS